MKRIKHIILISLVLFSTGCKEDDKLIFESITEETGTAGGLRTINLISPSIDLNDIANSEFSVEVEEWDDQDGGLLESVDVFVQFQDFTPENGTNNKSEVLVLNVPSSSFQVSESSGLPRAVISVAAADAVGLLGLDASSEIDGGDVFRFRLALNLTDGSVFSSNNLEGNLTGVFFNSPFSYPANVVCNLDPTLFAGTYQMEFVSGSGGFGPSLGDQQVTIVANSGTQRSTQVTWLPAGGAQTLTFDLVCGKINVPLYSTGLACAAGAGAITWQTTGEQATFDPTDDSEFFVRYNDFVNDGGCAVPSYEVVLRFVKI